MPSFTHGRNTALRYRGYDIGQYMKEVTWVNEVDAPETTAFGSTTRSYVVGFPNYTASMSGMYASSTLTPLDATSHVDDFMNTALGTPTPGWLLYAPAGPTVGNTLKALYSHNNNYSVNGTSTDVVAVSCDFEGSGYYYGNAAVIVAPTDTKTGNATHAWTFDRGVAAPTSRLEYRVFAQGLNVSDVSVTMTAKHSTDNSTYNALSPAGTSAAVAGAPWEIAWVGTPLQRYVRLEIVVAGSTNSPVFSILAGLYVSAT